MNPQKSNGSSQLRGGLSEEDQEDFCEAEVDLTNDSVLISRYMNSMNVIPHLTIQSGNLNSKRVGEVNPYQPVLEAEGTKDFAHFVSRATPGNYLKTLAGNGQNLAEEVPNVRENTPGLLEDIINNRTSMTQNRDLLTNVEESQNNTLDIKKMDLETDTPHITLFHRDESPLVPTKLGKQHRKNSEQQFTEREELLVNRKAFGIAGLKNDVPSSVNLVQCQPLQNNTEKFNQDIFFPTPAPHGNTSLASLGAIGSQKSVGNSSQKSMNFKEQGTYSLRRLWTRIIIGRRGSDLPKAQSPILTTQDNMSLSEKEFELLHDYSHSKFVNAVGLERRLPTMRSTTLRNPISPGPLRLRSILSKYAIKDNDIQTKLFGKVMKDIKKRKNRCAYHIDRCRRVKEAFVRCYNLAKARVLAFFIAPIPPNSLVRVYWELIIVVFILYDIVAVPFSLSFNVEYMAVYLALDSVINLAFIMDMMLSFNTGYYYKGVVISNRRKIAIHYLKSWFAIDLLASFPYSIINEFRQIDQETAAKQHQFLQAFHIIRFFKLIRILRALKLNEVFKKIQENFQVSRLLNGIFGFLKLAFLILFVAHFLACFWHLIGRNASEDENSWMKVAQIEDDSIKVRYITSLYWAVTTMITVGYGDITPVNPNEKVFVIVCMITGCGVFGYSMNQIGKIINEIDGGLTYNKQRIDTLNRYMRRKKISMEMQARVRKYLEYVMETERLHRSQDEEVLSMLSSNLKGELTAQVNGRVLRDNALFSQSFTSKFIDELSKLLNERSYTPEEVIFNEKEFGSEIFFIVAGKINIFYSGCRNVVLNTLKRGDYFGEIGFFSEQPRQAGAKSTNFANLFVLNKSDFATKLTNFHADKEFYCMLKDKMTIYNDFNDLKIKCYSCDTPGHLASRCPRTHLILDRSKTITQYWRDNKVFRRNYVRMYSRHHRLNPSILTAHSKRFMQDFAEELELRGFGYSQEEVGSQIMSPTILKRGPSERAASDRDRDMELIVEEDNQVDLLSFRDGAPKKSVLHAAFEQSHSRYSDASVKLSKLQSDANITPSGKNNKRNKVTLFAKNLVMRSTESSIPLPNMRRKTRGKTMTIRGATFDPQSFSSLVEDIDAGELRIKFSPERSRATHGPRQVMQTKHDLSDSEEDAQDEIDPYDTELWQDFIEFDRMRNYEVYFPHNNASKIIEGLGGAKPRERSRMPLTGTEREQFKHNLGIKIGRIFSKQLEFDNLQTQSPLLKSLSPAKIPGSSRFFGTVKNSQVEVKSDVTPDSARRVSGNKTPKSSFQPSEKEESKDENVIDKMKRDRKSGSVIMLNDRQRNTQKAKLSWDAPVNKRNAK